MIGLGKVSKDGKGLVTRYGARGRMLEQAEYNKAGRQTADKMFNADGKVRKKVVISEDGSRAIYQLDLDSGKLCRTA